MIRVLHVVTYMGRGGLETMLMNYYRHIDRSKVQFDFLVHREFEADYDEEIKSLGGRIYHVSRLVPWSRKYKAELRRFFRTHSEYKIVHVHQDCLSSVALQCAKEYDHTPGDRAQRHGDDDVPGVPARRAGSRAALPVLGELVALVFEVDKRPVLAVALQDDAAALAAVTAVGAAESHEFFTAEMRRAGPSVSRTGKYLHVIYKVRTCHTLII